MRWGAVALLVLVALAGCSGGGPAGAGGPSSTLSASLAPGTGGVQGVVVDEAIRPVQGANVTLSGGGSGAAKSAVTGADGAFLFESLAPGAYTLVVKHFRYGLVQSTVQVEAGAVATPKLQVQRLFSQEPYHETLKFDGFIQCGYDLTALSSICFQDYTHFVGPTTCPQCEHVFDNRGTQYAVGPGWQTQVYEMVWDPSAQATSDQMRITVSFYPRVASHWYCTGWGPSPVLVRIESGVQCEESQGDPQPYPVEGLNNSYVFAATKAPDGQFASATVSQSFTLFMDFFYYGKPPEDWSFVRGDPFPF